MAAQIHVGDIGTSFKLTINDEDGVALDVSTATTRRILFTKPDATVLTKTASLVNSGTDGMIKYVSQSGDLSIAGLWQIQAYISFSGVTEMYSNVANFRVHNNLV